eukprot:UC1_evm4s1960
MDAILARVTAAKEAAEEEKERRKEMAREMRQQRKAAAAAAAEGGGGDLSALIEQAEARGRLFEATEEAAAAADEGAAASAASAAGSAGGVRETSRRAFFREFRKVVEAADVILQVLDARSPLACRSAEVETAVAAAGPNKRLVLVLNKIDLVPREVVEAWLKHLRNEYPTVAFKAATQSQRTNIAHTRGAAVGGEAGAGAQGAGTLLKLFGNYQRNQQLKTAIRVGVVGYPNVGKSSIINSLKRARVCGVGAMPGFTRANQEVALDKHVKLIDSPGIVMARGTDVELVLRNCVKLEQIGDPVAPVEAILERCSPEQVMERYAVPRYDSAMMFLQHLARRLGRMSRGGVPDCNAAAKVVLQDWNSGRIAYYTRPPAAAAAKAHVSAAVVTEMAAAFDMDSLISHEKAEVLSSLQSVAEHGAAGSGSGGGALVMTAMQVEPRVEYEEDLGIGDNIAMDTSGSGAGGEAESGDEAGGGGGGEDGMTVAMQPMTSARAAARKRASMTAAAIPVKRSATVSAAAAADEAEAALNPRANKARRKAQKAAARERRRESTTATTSVLGGVEGVEDGAEDTYVAAGGVAAAAEPYSFDDFVPAAYGANATEEDL